MMCPSLRQNENSHRTCHIGELPEILTFFLSNNEDVSMLKFVWEKLGIGHFVLFLAHMLLLNLIFHNWRPMQSVKFNDF